MKIIIKNPAPLGANQKKWGDYHFGRSLTKQLERLGHEVHTHYRGEWQQADAGDAVVVLRGKYRYRPSRQVPNLLWCMSNPSTISVDECDQFDVVCVASVTHAEQLRRRLKIPVHPLLQCTDLEQFEPKSPPVRREGIIFVGNSRGVRRPCIDWAINARFDLAIYGRGWRDFGLQGHVAAEYIDNERLPDLYHRSRVSLNDHWQDMRNMGYVNNRIFDCLAAGLPVITDDFPELRAIAGDELQYYRDRDSFLKCMKTVQDDYESVLARQQALWKDLRRGFSFDSRAEFIAGQIEAVRRTRAQATTRTGPEASRPLSSPFDAGQFAHIRQELSARPEGHYCPVCGAHGPSFIAGGVVKKRPNAKCPRCGALERHRLFWLYFVNDLWPRLPARTKQLLHVAPEDNIARLLHEADDINYLSGDLFMPNVMVKLDLTAIDFPDNRFDVILCSHILEHIPDDRRAMREMLRVIRPGGFAIIIVPLYGSTTYEDPCVTTAAGRLEHFGQEDHVRKYGEDIEARLVEAGFDVRTRRFAKEVAPEIARYTALREQVIYECRKPSLRAQ